MQLGKTTETKFVFLASPIYHSHLCARDRSVYSPEVGEIIEEIFHRFVQDLEGDTKIKTKYFKLKVYVYIT